MRIVVTGGHKFLTFSKAVWRFRELNDQSHTIAHHKNLQMDSQTGTKRVLTFSLFMYKNTYNYNNINM